LAGFSTILGVAKRNRVITEATTAAARLALQRQTHPAVNGFDGKV
jgi:hypothetical protein